MDIVLLFPGQGSQKPGMAKDLYDALPAARSALESADRALGVSLTALMFDGPADDLTLTHNAQPALLAHGAAVWAATREHIAPHVRAAAGHSLGEFTAYHAAGALALEAAVQLVRRRGELMYETGVKRPGAMAAILGDPSEPIESICEKASAEAGLVVPANYNCPGQLVISGEVAGVERAMVLVKEAGAKRAVRLNVSGAFHSPLMSSAAAGLKDALASAHVADPRFPVYSNVSTHAVSSGGDASRLLLEQLTSPVRWTQEITNLTSRYPDALYVEMGPGSVLVGLVKKIAPAVQTMTCGTVPEVEQLLERVA